METVRYQFGELVELLLLILRVLCFLDEPDDFFLDLLGQVQVIHSCIDSIDLLLQDDSFLVDVVHQDGQLSEQVSLCNSTHDIRDRYENQLLVVSSSEVITEQEQATGVEADAILVWVGLVEEGATVVPSPDVVERRNPLLLAVNDIEPDAGNEVNVHQQEENQFDELN